MDTGNDYRYILDRIIEEEQAALKMRLAAAADNFNGCRLRFLVDDGGTTAFTAGMQFVENKDGSLTVTVKQASGPIGDMVGMALSFAGTVDVTKLAFFDASKTVNGMQVSPKENLTSFDGANYMNFNGTKMAFDALFLFGTNGIATDDIQSVSFNLYRTDGIALHASDITEAGVRTQSIGDLGARTASDKDWEIIDKGACFELKSDYVLGVSETDVIKRAATGNFLADLQASDPTAKYEILTFTGEDGVVHKAGETVYFKASDGTARFAFTLNKDGSWSVTDGDTAASLDAGRFVSTLITYEAQKISADGTTAEATADVVVGVKGENTAETIRDASYSLREGDVMRFKLTDNINGDTYGALSSRVMEFRIAEAILTNADGTVTKMDPAALRSVAYINKIGEMVVDTTRVSGLGDGQKLELIANYMTVDGINFEKSANIGVATVSISGAATLAAANDFASTLAGEAARVNLFANDKWDYLAERSPHIATLNGAKAVCDIYGDKSIYDSTTTLDATADLSRAAGDGTSYDTKLSTGDGMADGCSYSIRLASGATVRVMDNGDAIYDSSGLLATLKGIAAGGTADYTTRDASIDPALAIGGRVDWESALAKMGVVAQIDAVARTFTIKDHWSYGITNDRADLYSEAAVAVEINADAFLGYIIGDATRTDVATDQLVSEQLDVLAT